MSSTESTAKLTEGRRGTLAKVKGAWIPGLLEKPPLLKLAELKCNQSTQPDNQTTEPGTYCVLPSWLLWLWRHHSCHQRAQRLRGRDHKKAAPTKCGKRTWAGEGPCGVGADTTIFVNVAKSLGALGGKHTFHPLGKSLSKEVHWNNKAGRAYEEVFGHLSGQKSNLTGRELWWLMTFWRRHCHMGPNCLPSGLGSSPAKEGS